MSKIARAIIGYRRVIVFTSKDDDKECFDKILSDVIRFVDGKFIEFDLSGLDVLHEPFLKPCRFGEFCTDEKLYESCVKDKRVKNNWMCWRDGITTAHNSSEERAIK